MMRRSLLRALEQQQLADEAARELALRVEELQRSQEEKARLHDRGNIR
jgi:hypothetical protein